MVDSLKHHFAYPTHWVKDHDPFLAMRELTMEKGDFLLCSPMKTGQHWMWEIMNMLLAGKAEHIKYIKESSWIDVASMDDINQQCEKPRVLCTHIPVGWLPDAFRYDQEKITPAFTVDRNYFVN